MDYGCQRLREELEQLEMHLEATAAAGRPSPWIERLRGRVRVLRERLEAEPEAQQHIALVARGSCSRGL